MRTLVPARVTCVLASALVLLAGAAAPAMAGKGGGGNGGGGTARGGKPSKISVTALTGPAAVQAAHDATCPKVVEATVCASLAVKIADFGNTGWAGQASPATSSVTYNSYYSTATQDDWSQVVAHEVGGHVDAWNEIVGKVGVSQAWTDYYDLDFFASPWAPARWGATATAPRTFTTTEAKEAYLDCAGPVAHGYRGNYLYRWRLTTTTQQQTFCVGADGVMTSALTSSRG